jgi:hypothetical protein
MNGGKTVYIHIQDSYRVTEDNKTTNYHVIAIGKAAFSQQIFEQFDLLERIEGREPNKYDYDIILNQHLYTMFNSCFS